MTAAVSTLVTSLAKRLDLGTENSTELTNILKNTAFKTKETVSDAQMAALLIVANQYGLNPFVKELFAYPDSKNGIVPVVSVDGWARIINDHPEFDGMEFRYSEATITHKGKTCHEWVECLMYRKDRSRPVVIRERFEEVVRSVSFTTPWDTHPNRLHRHKTLIQCARIAFGFAGIHDEDEAQRIIEAGSIDASTGEVKQAEPKALPEYPQDLFYTNFPQWKKVIESKKKTSDEVISMVSTKYTLTKKQIDQIVLAGEIANEVADVEYTEENHNEAA